MSKSRLHPDSVFDIRRLPLLLRGETEPIARWVHDPQAGNLLRCAAIIAVSSALFGAAAGWWRSPLQAACAAAKFPLLILGTTLGNALINSMLAPLLGLNLGFRQSLLTILMSFTVVAAILGAFSPLLLFMALNTPTLAETGGNSVSGYNTLLISQVAIIAFAGLAAHARLWRLLRRLGGGAPVARKVFCAWLAVNLFLGSQVSWILRPFVGSPGLPVRFLRPDAFQGNFYEAVYHSFLNLFH